MTINRKWLEWRAPKESDVGTGKRGESAGSSAKVTSINSGYDGLAEYEKLVAFAKCHENNVPPLVNDILARAINRLQGWERFAKRVRLAPNVLRNDFSELHDMFLEAKHSGSYTDDRLPVLKGGGRNVTAVRLQFVDDRGGQRHE